MHNRRTRDSKGVRIIGGEWRGRRLGVPEGTSVRPTPDRVRETLFNWLAGVVPGARCLDLFAGTGVLGLEALSRGAQEAWFVERAPVLSDALEEQIERLGAHARIIRSDVLEVLETRPVQRFDIVFADPPYEMDMGEVLGKLSPWLTSDHYIYVERSSQRGQDSLKDMATGARVMKQSQAGQVSYGLLRLDK